MIKTLKIQNAWNDKEYNIAFRIAKYCNGNTAIIMECFTDDEVYDGDYGKLTVNLDIRLKPGYGHVDVNNLGGEIVDWIEENGLGEDTGERDASGFCVYPVFKFNMEKIKEYSRS